MYSEVREFSSRWYPKKGKKRNRKQEQEPQSSKQEKKFPSVSESCIKHASDVISEWNKFFGTNFLKIKMQLQSEHIIILNPMQF